MSRDVIRALEDAYGDSHRDLVYAYAFLGSSLEAQRRYEEAAEAFRHAAEMSGSVNLPDHPYTARSWKNYAEARIKQGMDAEAETALRTARAIYLRGLRFRTDSIAIGNEVAAVDTTLARVLIGRGTFDEAIDLLREAVMTARDSALIASANNALRTLTGDHRVRR
jgi:tetratricopeptide (TPR) repeat protein